MNILYLDVDSGIPVHGRYGASIRIRSMIDAFVRAGHQVTLVTPRPGPADGPISRAKIILVPPPPGQNAPDEMEARNQKSLAYWDKLYTITRELLTRQNFDFVYEQQSLWSDTGARLVMATRLPMVLEVNAPLRRETARLGVLSNPSRAALIELTQLAFATAVIVVSDCLKQYVIERGAKAERVHVLPDGVDSRRFHPAVGGGQVRRRGSDDAILIGHVSQRQRDLPLLLKAFAALRETDSRYHLMIVGEISDGLIDQIAGQGLADGVILTGPIPRDEAPQYMAAMDVAVSFHVPEPDHSPVQLAEYLACGVPTVLVAAGCSGGIVIEGETGWLCPPGDAQALADKVQAVIADPARSRQIAWQGAAAVLRNHTWDGRAAAVAELIRPGVSEPAPANRRQVSEPILDPHLRRRLYRATRPDLAKTFLAANLPMFTGEGSEKLIGVGRMELLNYTPGRHCMLGYELWGWQRSDGRFTYRRIVGKLFQDDRGRRLDRLLRWLWRSDFNPDAADRITVPEPLGYIPDMQMQLQGYAAGKSLHDLVREQQVAPLVIRAAEALVKLHRTPLPTPIPPGSGRQADDLVLTPYRLTDELACLERVATRLADARPRFAKELWLLPAAFRDWGSFLRPPVETTPVHRDFSYRQLLFDGRHLTLIHYDRLAEGDAAVDVASFAVHLRYLGLVCFGDLNALAGEAELFLDTYGRLQTTDEGFWNRVEFYQAAAWYRLLGRIDLRPDQNQIFADLYRQTKEALRWKPVESCFL